MKIAKMLQYFGDGNVIHVSMYLSVSVQMGNGGYFRLWTAARTEKVYHVWSSSSAD